MVSKESNESVSRCSGDHIGDQYQVKPLNAPADAAPELVEAPQDVDCQ